MPFKTFYLHPEDFQFLGNSFFSQVGNQSLKFESVMNPGRRGRDSDPALVFLLLFLLLVLVTSWANCSLVTTEVMHLLPRALSIYLIRFQPLVTTTVRWWFSTTTKRNQDHYELTVIFPRV